MYFKVRVKALNIGNLFEYGLLNYQILKDVKCYRYLITRYQVSLIYCILHIFRWLHVIFYRLRYFPSIFHILIRLISISE